MCKIKQNTTNGKRLQDQLYFGFDGTVEKTRLADSTVTLYTDETAYSALLQNLSESWPHVEKDGELAAGTRAAHGDERGFDAHRLRCRPENSSCDSVVA